MDYSMRETLKTPRKRVAKTAKKKAGRPPAKKWSEMTIKEKRIAVLKDVLKYSKKGLIIAEQGMVLDPQLDTVRAYAKRHKEVLSADDLPEHVDDMAELMDCSLQDVLKLGLKKGEPCTVCARGALLHSIVVRDNKFNTNEVTGGSFSIHSRTDKRIMKLFPATPVSLMEIAFERSQSMSVPNVDYPDDSISEAVTFGGHFDDDDTRLQAIVNAAIKNHGLFDPFKANADYDE
jgi:hypothetical protein